jgi:hypothetical protein
MLSVADGMSPTPYSINRHAAKVEHAVMAPHSLPTGRRHAANAGRYPLQQHGHDCYEVGYAHIRERVANGGPPWTPREPLPPEAAAADDDGLDIPAFLRRNGGAR